MLQVGANEELPKPYKTIQCNKPCALNEVQCFRSRMVSAQESRRHTSQRLYCQGSACFTSSGSACNIDPRLIDFNSLNTKLLSASVAVLEVGRSTGTKIQGDRSKRDSFGMCRKVIVFICFLISCSLTSGVWLLAHLHSWDRWLQSKKVPDLVAAVKTASWFIGVVLPDVWHAR